MHSNRTILAIFKDYEDAAFWSNLLRDVPGVVRVTAGDNPASILESLRQTGMEATLTIISTKLYPLNSQEIIPIVRKNFPATEFLLVSSSQEAAPPLQPLIKDGVRHLVIDPVGPDKGSQMVRAVRKLMEKSPWKMGDYLFSGASVHEFRISSSEQKEELISAIGGLIPGDSEEAEMLREKGALLADEMLENAMYGAPRDESGGKIFQKGEKRAMLPGERIVFRFGFDGETLAMEVADGWGSLSPETVMEHLEPEQEGGEVAGDWGGRGLFILWRFLDQLHISITPGRQTVVGGHIRLTTTEDPLTTPRGFHISTFN
ncbi:MAG: ATP-binding protein [Geobacter sp.]|nr:ATP-binding protein [Geobacter sp.]